MGIGQSLQTALGGLRATQKGIEVTAKNVANANTEGYSRKTLSLTNKVSGDKAFGVQTGAITRQVDRFMQGRVHKEYAEFNRLNVQSQFLDHIDNMFGKPGDAGSLDTIVNNVNKSLVTLANSPQTSSARQGVVESAGQLASHLRDLSAQVQEMRRTTENQISQEVEKANVAMRNIAKINYQIANSGGQENIADLQDQLDNNIDDLAAIIDIKITESNNGGAQVFTQNGILLVEGNAPTMNFSQKSYIGANNLYSVDQSKSGVGTISIIGGDGSRIDLIQQGSTKSGTLGGLLDLRDNKLVAAQDQLDELAHGLAKAFNTKTVAGEDFTAGINAGKKLDLTGLQNGDVAEFSFKDNATGITHNLSFVKVSDPALLPLSDTATNKANDKVFGIDFTGGDAAVKTQIEAAIASVNANFTVTNTGSEIQIVDDGGGNQVDVLGFNAQQTVTGVQGEGAALNLFVDLGDYGEKNYTGSLENGGQKRGFAGRIALSNAIKKDNSLLVKETTTTDMGSQVRPADLLKKFANTNYTFSADSGIGSSNSPFSGSIDDFTRQVVAKQTALSGANKTQKQSQELLLGALKGKMEASTKVNVDEEMANLLNLQTSYAANARIVSVIKELMDMLIRM